MRFSMLNSTRCNMLNRNGRGNRELKAAVRSDTYARTQIDTKKDWNNCPTDGSHPVQLEERLKKNSVHLEGWDTMMKRKRSVGPTSKRGFKSGSNQNVRLKSTSTLTFHSQGSRADISLDDSIDNHSTRIKIKTSRTSRSGTSRSGLPSVHHSDFQTLNETSDELEQHVSAANSSPIDMMHGQSCRTTCDHAKATTSGQKSRKDLSCRRPNALSSLVLKPDEARNQSSGLATSSFATKDLSSVINQCVAHIAANDSNQECVVRFDKVSGPVLLSEDKEVHRCKEVPADHIQKARGLSGELFASMVGIEKERVALRSCISMDEMAGQWKNVVKTTSLENIRPGVKKTRSKSCRSPSLKQSGRRTFSRGGRKLQIQDPAEIDDDHQEKLAAASSACKASYRACSSRLWMKMEPVFGPVSTKDKCFLKQQLSCGEVLEDSLSQGFFMCEVSADAEMLREGSYPVFNEADKVAFRIGAGNGFGRVSSLYERVLSALIEEDDNSGFCNIGEGMCTSIQCPSDGSHCDSCNCVDVETRDGDRFDFEAESKYGVQMQKHSHGDKSSCDRSISSNTTRNSSVSDSLYSSGRCQGDDGLSHSDEFVSEVCQNNQSGSLAANISIGGSPISDSQYQLMSIDEKLLLELQSIGLLLDSLPGLDDKEEEEVIDQDIRENLGGLYQRIVKKKMTLTKIAKFIQDDRERNKRDIEQVAVDKLVEMAYKGRMVCRADLGSRRVIRRVSKQFATGFMKRTLARCQEFELTGQSCFHEPYLQKAISSALEGEQTEAVGLDAEVSCTKAAKHEISSRGSGFNSTSTGVGASHSDPCPRSLGSVQEGRHIPEYCSTDYVLAPQKESKTDTLFSDFACGSSSQGAAGSVRALVKAKRKRSARDTIHKKSMMKRCMVFAKDHLPDTLGSGRTKEKSKTKAKLTSSSVNKFGSNSGYEVPCIQPCPSFKALDFGDKESGKKLLLTSPGVDAQNSLEKENQPDIVGIDPLEELGVSNDLSSWFEDEGLQDYDSIGLEIPMDDISELQIF